MPIDGWREVRLRDVAALNPEQLMNDTPPSYRFQYLDIASIERIGRIGEGHSMSFADAPSRAKRRARTGDILVSTVRPYLRSFALIRNAPNNLVASTGFTVVRPRHANDAEFIYQHILSSRFVEFLIPRMKGGNYPAVTADDVGAFPLLLPGYLERSRIAAILSSIDDVIEKTEAVIAQLQVVKQAMMQELLTRGLPGRHTRFKMTEIGEMPMEWRVERLVALLREPIKNGYSPVCPTTPTGRWILHLGAVTHDGFNPNAVKPAPLDNPGVQAAILEQGDLLVSRSNTRERVGLVGIFNGTPVHCSYPDLLMRVRTLPTLNVNYLEQVLLSSRARRYFSQCARGTSESMVKINRQTLEQFSVAIPPPEEQSEIADAAFIFSDRISAERAVAMALKAMKDILATVLLTGELRVTGDQEIAA
jgi:type I restriction enzyme S subunit